MEKITIKIPDNLNKTQEAFEIVKHLGKKLLPTNNKYIGNSYELKNLQTQINVIRIPTEKVIVTIDCSVCNTLFEKKSGKKIFVNYGGKILEKNYCCQDCADYVLGFLGENRASNRKNLLNAGRFY